VKLQKEALILERFIEVIKLPYGDFSAIGQLSEAINEIYSLQPLVEFVSREPQGKRAFEERPRLGKVDLRQLHQLPENTLGYIYADRMLRNGFTPPPAREIAEDDYSFLSAHIAETHDIWHVVTGCDTDKAGEIQLQAFYVAQFSASRLFLALLSKNFMKTALEDIELCERHMDALAQGWLLGKQARPLFGIQWNKLWETPLETLRVQLNLAQPAGSVTAAKVD
jgi:ubiquinone biosynthesis protein COQ4